MNIISALIDKNNGTRITKKALFFIAVSMIFLLFSVQQSAALVYEVSGNFGDEENVRIANNWTNTGYTTPLYNGSFRGTYSFSFGQQTPNWQDIEAFHIEIYDQDSNLEYTLSSTGDFAGAYDKSGVFGYLRFFYYNSENTNSYGPSLHLAFEQVFIGDGDMVLNGASFTSWHNCELGHYPEILYLVEGSSHVAPVPEPATMLLLGTGLVGLSGARRRLKK